LDHRAVIGYDTNAKMNPPLRSPEDVQAIRDGLKDGVIDVIATDHAPHSPLEKNLEFDQAAFGIIGLETSLPLTMELVRDGILSLENAVAKMTNIPASILGVKGGTIQEGQPADLAVIDLENEFTFSKTHIKSKSANSPFIGRKMKGRNLMTIVDGKIIWERDVEHSGS
jgi:dihydroorotase